MKKYYFAYNERYKKVHSENLTWFSSNPTPELLEWIKYNNIPIEEGLCEIGCGEGRDSLYLASKGYKMTAIDVSQCAIDKCNALAKEKGLKVNWHVADALYLKNMFTMHFKWIYSIATLHMLVEDKDRQKFLSSIYQILDNDGKLLLVSKGNGSYERTSDITKAFELQTRRHNLTQKEMQLVGTSYRAINWANHISELEKAGFNIEKTIDSENDEYQECMVVYLSKKKL